MSSSDAAQAQGPLQPPQWWSFPCPRCNATVYFPVRDARNPPRVVRCGPCSFESDLFANPSAIPVTPCLGPPSAQLQAIAVMDDVLANEPPPPPLPAHLAQAHPETVTLVRRFAWILRAAAPFERWVASTCDAPQTRGHVTIYTQLRTRYEGTVRGRLVGALLPLAVSPTAGLALAPFTVTVILVMVLYALDATSREAVYVAYAGFVAACEVGCPVFASLSLVFMGLFVTREPGYQLPPPATARDDAALRAMTLTQLREAHRCPQCLLHRPPGLVPTVHCKVCGLCVEGYDHHCKVLGSCVGRRNHAYFAAYILTCGAALFCAIVWLLRCAFLWPSVAKAPALNEPVPQVSISMVRVVTMALVLPLLLLFSLAVGFMAFGVVAFCFKGHPARQHSGADAAQSSCTDRVRASLEACRAASQLTTDALQEQA